MKWIGAMVVNLLVVHNFIEEDQKHEVKQSFDDSFTNSENSQNVIVKEVNSFLKTPLGVLAAIWGYVKLSSLIREESAKNRSLTVQEEFELEMESRMMKKMLDKYGDT